MLSSVASMLAAHLPEKREEGGGEHLRARGGGTREHDAHR